MKNVILLAAGKSSRFGRNKLEEKFGGCSLPLRAAKWAMANGCENLYLTLSRSAVKTDGSNVYHPVLKELRDAGIEPKVAFQPEDSYGPGAAVSVWSQVITEPVTILFGDNYYAGSVPKVYNDMLDSDYSGAIFTTRSIGANPRNLQLAAVANGFILEKPHSILRGDYFCGFARLPAGYLQQLGQLKKSERGEIEITEMVNFAKERTHWDIDALGLQWLDLTYESDVANMRELIGHEG